MLPGEVRGRRLANVREEQTLRVLVAREWGRSARFPAPLFATQQHVLVSSTWRWPSTSQPNTAASFAQVSGTEAGHRVEEACTTSTAATVPRLVVHPQIPRGHEPVHRRRGLFDHAHGLGWRNDALVRVLRSHLVGFLIIVEFNYCRLRRNS